MIKTDFVYVCSVDFWRYLFLSMRSLFASGTQIERVTIYVVGDSPVNWKFNDPRIVVKMVPDICEDYWEMNKAHLCNSEAERVVFLDTDVFILQPIDQLWKGRNEDFLARYGVEMYTKFWHPDKWQAALRTVEGADYPQYTSGFMIFQNGSHRRIKDTWIRLIEEILADQIPSIPPNRFAELYALSLAASVEQLTHYPMEEYGHRYAMLGESPDDAVVYHLGTPAFYRHYLPLEKKTGLYHRQDLPVSRPPFLKVQDLYTRVKHRLKSRFIGSRDKHLKF